MDRWATSLPAREDLELEPGTQLLESGFTMQGADLGAPVDHVSPVLLLLAGLVALIMRKRRPATQYKTPIGGPPPA